MDRKYDYLIVGAGLFGAVFAHEAHKAGKKVLVIDKRPHIAGNIYTEEVEGIQVTGMGRIFSTPQIACGQAGEGHLRRTSGDVPVF